jgi:uncharacterized OB-fold protein
MVEPLVPVSDARSAPFFDATRAGKLVLQRCRGCGTWLHPVRARCPECSGTEIEWAQASGRGRLYSHGRLHRAYHPDLERRLPVTLAVVDLEEGVRLSSRLVDAGAAELRAGMPVEVAFERVSPEVTVPVFRPCSREDSK